MEKDKAKIDLAERRIRLKLKPNIVIPSTDRDEFLKTLYGLGIIPDKFALELLQKMEQDALVLPLTYLTPKSWDCVPGTSFGEFFTKALSMRAMDLQLFSLCSIADAFRVATLSGPEFRGHKFVLGMIPKMCSDKQCRTLTLNKDHEGVWIESIVLSEIIDVEQPYLFRFIGDRSATYQK